VLLGLIDRQLTDALAPGFRNIDAQVSPEVSCGQGRVGSHEVLQPSGKNHVATFRPRHGTQIEDVVGCADDGFLMLHHDHGVSHIPQPGQDLDQPLRIVGVKSDARLVQYIGAAHEAAAQARAQLNALAFPATEGGAAPVEREVSQSYIQQELQPVLQFDQEAFGNVPFLSRQLQTAQGIEHFIDGKGQKVGEGVPIDPDMACFRLQTTPTAGIT